jgi:Metal-sensitive transcriptional repressor
MIAGQSGFMDHMRGTGLSDMAAAAARNAQASTTGRCFQVTHLLLRTGMGYRGSREAPRVDSGRHGDALGRYPCGRKGWQDLAADWPVVCAAGSGKEVVAVAQQAQHGYIDDKEAYLRRLKRIEGQARGLQRMVDDEQYCIRSS